MTLRWNIFDHVRVLGIGILLMGLLLIGAVVARLFVLPPAVASLPASSSDARLNTATIDRLELWIEEVEDQRRAGLKLPAQPVFVVEDLKLEEPI